MASVALLSFKRTATGWLSSSWMPFGQAINTKGKPFTVNDIGSALAGRMIGEHLRSMGEITKGPAPFGPADRSRFLQALDEAVHRAKRAKL